MGMSLKATLFYGIPLNETDEESNSYNSEKYEYVSEWPMVERNGDTKEDWDKYFKEVKRVEEASEVETFLVGYGDFVYFCLGIKGTIFDAYDGSADLINIPTARNEEWDKTIERWCKENDLEFVQPGWRLAGTYW